MAPDWKRVSIAGHEANVFDTGPTSPPFSLIWLHDEVGDRPASLTNELARRRLRCVAPFAPACWWSDRITPAFDQNQTAETHLLDDVMNWIATEWNIAARGVAIAGIGMGGQGALRIGLRHPQTISVVASIAGAFDFHEQYGTGSPLDAMYPSREHARQGTAILQVHGYHWPAHIHIACPPGHRWYRGNDRLHEKLSALGVPHAADLDSALSPDALLVPMLDFVVAACERESRRLM